MCTKAVEKFPWSLEHVPYNFKTQEMCDDAVRDYLFPLQYVPDWFVTQQQLNLWHDYDYLYNDDKLIEWYDGYKKRKAQKASVKEELISITWHPSKYWD